jgi:hypothetical protein
MPALRALGPLDEGTRPSDHFNKAAASAKMRPGVNQLF